MDDYSHIYNESTPLIVRQESFDNVLQHYRDDSKLINAINRMVTRGIIIVDKSHREHA